MNMKNDKEQFELEEKILRINLLLDNDDLLENYLDNIENKELEVPKELSNNIMKSIEKNENKNKNLRSTINIYSILKIAACTIFAILIWYKIPKNENFSNIHNANLEISTHEKFSSNINGKINGLGEKVTRFFTVTNYSFEGGNVK